MAWENKPNPQGYPKDWPVIRSRYMSRHRFCEVQSEGCTRNATEVDHISGDVNDSSPSNLRAVCRSCHQKITILNGQDSRNRPAERPSPKSPGVLEKPQEAAGDVLDDTASTDESEWFETLGEVYEKDSFGNWKQPLRTLGPFIIMWAIKNLRLKGEPLKFTPEQTRYIYWIYALNEDGTWLNNRTLHIGPKGSGKDPFGASLCAIELAGPARFSHWDENGNPVPKRQENAWVQIAGVTISMNSSNTWPYLAEMFSPEAVERYGIEVQAENIYARKLGRSRIQSVAASSRSLEGNFPTFVMLSETQHWLESTGHFRLYSVIDRNLAKVNGSHSYVTTNAYDPNENSVAQRMLENWREFKQGRRKNPKLMVISMAATHKAPFETEEQRMKVLKKVYGSAAKYTNVKQFSDKFDDATEDVMESLRFYYNVIGVNSRSFVDINDWDKCVHPLWDSSQGVPRGSRILLAFDGSRNQDSTALMGLITEGPLAGTIVYFGVWERPSYLKPDAEWNVPREEVDAVVEEIHRSYRVLGFWCDPSHRKTADGNSSYWIPIINEWHRRYSRKYLPNMWASGSSHSTNFDMTVFANQKAFVAAVSAFEQEVTDKTIRHDGNYTVRSHIQNARRFNSKRFGDTIAKESSGSKKKIDLAVCAIIVYLMYSTLMTSRKTGRLNQMRDYKLPESDK